MNLKAYLRSLPTRAAREQFAIDCGTTYGHMRNACYDASKQLAPAVCVRIERLSGGRVSRRTLRSDWRDIWPELTLPRTERPAEVTQ